MIELSWLSWLNLQEECGIYHNVRMVRELNAQMITKEQCAQQAFVNQSATVIFTDLETESTWDCSDQMLYWTTNQAEKT